MTDAALLDTSNADLAALIRMIPDFPKPGIQFRDITTLLLDAKGFAASVARLADAVPAEVDLIAGIEARGFIFASAVAHHLGKGLLLIRKDGKLPGRTVGVDYALEYGADRVEMHADACVPGQRVLLIDDLIATGGTALAAIRLLREAGAEVAGAGFVIDLPDLGGADRLRGEGVTVAALVAFEGD
jgi:adenine phosphoribosyltransferase